MNAFHPSLPNMNETELWVEPSAGPQYRMDDDDRDTDEVPVDRDVVEQGHQADVEGVQEALQEEDDGQDAEDVPGREPVHFAGQFGKEGRDHENAQPKLMPAVTATCPSRLNQPVNHDHQGPLLPGASLADQ